MRERFWNNLINVRFQAFYYQRCGSYVEIIDRSLSIFLALVSSTSVGLWVFWKNNPILWGAIITISQLVIIVKPFLPFLRKSAEYVRCAFELERLYNTTEKVWFACERRANDAEFERAFCQLRERKTKVDARISSLPTFPFWYVTKKARNDIDEFMRINFPPKP